MTGYGGRTTTGYLTYLFNQSYNASMMSPSTLITLNTYAATNNADYSSSATYVFQPTSGYLTTWYAETVNSTYNAGGATAVVVGLN
jgi:predicted metal-binding membrane protein